MGLFINKNGHPNVFNTTVEILEQNQKYSKINPLEEWMIEQMQATDSANLQLSDMEKLLKQQKQTQANQIRAIRNSLMVIKESDFQHEKFKVDVMKSFTKLEEKNRMLNRKLKQESSLNHEFVSQSNKEIISNIETVTAVNEENMTKINDQMNQNQQQLTEQISKHENVQKEVISRLNNQEGVLEKVVRQMDYLRSILYERTNFLTGKLEDSYSVTSSYISKLLSGSGSTQNSARFIVNQKQEEKKNNID